MSSLLRESMRVMRHEWARQAARARTHYNALASRQRRRGPAANVAARVRRARSTHNWIKALLIRRVAALRARDNRALDRVLELCGGRGGDVGKWQRVGARFVALVDASERSLDEARRRYASASSERALVTHVGDAFDTLPSSLCVPLPYDVVSCQFALHYAFESRERARAALTTAARAAAPNALFVATLPHAGRLRAEAHAAAHVTSCLPGNAGGAGAGRVVFGDDVFRVEAASLSVFDAAYGGRYSFTFDGAVDSLDEFVVQHASLVDSLDACGWDLVTYEPADEFLAAATRDDTLAETLRTRMRADPHDRLARVTRLYAVVVARRRSHTTNTAASSSSSSARPLSSSLATTSSSTSSSNEKGVQ